VLLIRSPEKELDVENRLRLTDTSSSPLRPGPGVPKNERSKWPESVNADHVIYIEAVH
jgi:hypothetical protein